LIKNGVQEGCDVIMSCLKQVSVVWLVGGTQEKHETVVTLASLERLNAG